MRALTRLDDVPNSTNVVIFTTSKSRGKYDPIHKATTIAKQLIAWRLFFPIFFEIFFLSQKVIEIGTHFF
jgi:hypothetical protein